MPSCCVISKADAVNTRMHSSRMRTVRCSGRLPGRRGGGVCLSGQGMGVSAWPGEVSVGLGGVIHPPPWTGDGKYFNVNGKSENN